MRIKTIGITVAAVIAAGMTIACGTGAGDNTNEGNAGNETSVTTDEAADIAGKLGDTIKLDDKMKVTVTEIKMDAKSSASYEKPNKGQYIAAYAEVEALTDTMIVGPVNFSIMDSDNVVYDAILTTGFDEALDTKTLDTGQKLKGWVIFDVNPDGFTGTGTVQYDWGFEDPATWSFTN